MLRSYSTGLLSPVNATKRTRRARSASSSSVSELAQSIRTNGSGNE